MLRLVWKDLVAARLLLLAGLPIYILNLAAMTGARPLFLGMSLVFSGVLAFGSMALEEVQGTGELWASLPVRRRDVVLGRYLTAIFGAGLGLGISWGVDRVVAVLRPASATPFTPAAGMAAHLMLLLVLLMVAAVLLPFCFRLGAVSGGLAFSACAVGTILVLSLAGQGVMWLAGISNPLLDPGLWRGGSDAVPASAWLQRWGGVLLGLGALLTAAALTVSAGLSRRFYELRDLPS